MAVTLEKRERDMLEDSSGFSVFQQYNLFIAIMSVKGHLEIQSVHFVVNF